MEPKKELGFQRDRYGLWEPTELVLGMSYKSKTFLQNFLPTDFFSAQSIHFRENLVSVLALICSFCFVKWEILCFFIYKGNLSVIKENEHIIVKT